MKHTELEIHSSSFGSELIQGIIINEGITTYSVEDPSDFNALLNDKTVPWDYIDESLMSRLEGEVIIKLYIPCDEQGNGRLKNIVSAVTALKGEYGDACGSLEIKTDEVDDADWADTWKKYFHPIEIGEKITVKPSWEPYESNGRTVIEIDPESSFGTGQHETTFLCLETLQQIPIEGKEVLDMGCGSGILAIGAAKLGSGFITAVDIEQNSTRIAKQNLQKNGIDGEKFRVMCGNLLDGGKFASSVLDRTYGVVLMNIVADVIIMMLPLLKDNIKGTVICSGIITERLEQVKKALCENGFDIADIKEKNGWAAVVARK